MNKDAVFVNAVSNSEMFDEVCDAARYLTMDYIEHLERSGTPMSTEDFLKFWNECFDLVWKKRMDLPQIAYGAGRIEP